MDSDRTDRRRISRRVFLSQAAALTAIVPIVGRKRQRGVPARGPAGGVDAAAMATIAAIASHIIPTDDTPGAAQGGVDTYIAGSLARSEPLRALYASGVREVDQSSVDRFGVPFIGLNPADQRAMVAAIQGTPFFKSVRALTIAGFYNSPAGWQSVGFPGHGQPMGHRDVASAPARSGRTSPARTLPAPNEPGRRDTERACGQCHDLRIATSLRQDEAHWRATVQKMIDVYHAPIQPDAAERITKYLSRRFTPK